MILDLELVIGTTLQAYLSKIIYGRCIRPESIIIRYLCLEPPRRCHPYAVRMSRKICHHPYMVCIIRYISHRSGRSIRSTVIYIEIAVCVHAYCHGHLSIRGYCGGGVRIACNGVYSISKRCNIVFGRQCPCISASQAMCTLPEINLRIIYFTTIFSWLFYEIEVIPDDMNFCVSILEYVALILLGYPDFAQVLPE